MRIAAGFSSRSVTQLLQNCRKGIGLPSNGNKMTISDTFVWVQWGQVNGGVENSELIKTIIEGTLMEFTSQANRLFQFLGFLL